MAEAIPPLRHFHAVLHLEPDGQLWGWALDPADPERRLVVEILGDGVCLAIIRADLYLDALRRAGHGDGCHGFAIRPDSRFPLAGYELRLANDPRVLAHCAAGAVSQQGPSPAFNGGHVIWRGGLRLSGTIRSRHAAAEDVELLQIYEGSTRIPTQLTWHAGMREAEDGRPFDLSLPVGLADGRPHLLRVTNVAGAELEGSPVMVMARHDGFAALGGGRDDPALGLLDRLYPASLPFEHDRDWTRLHEDEAAFEEVTSDRPLGVVILGREGSEATLASLRRQRGGIAIRVVIVEAASAGSPRFAAQDWNSACAELAAVPLVATLLVRAGTILRAFACQALIAAFAGADAAEEEISLCLADHELAGEDGARTPLFGPAFDYERLLSQGYAEGFFAMRALPALASGAAACSSFDVLFAALETAQAETGRIAHVPRILASVPRLSPGAASACLADAVRAHLERCGEEAHVEIGEGALLPLVHLRRPRPEGEVAIVIPTRDRLDLLKPCIASIRERTDHPDYRIVIVDNGSREQETLDYLDALSRDGAVLLRDDRSFNYARLNNLALREIASPFACLLNNDVEVLAPDWLSAMQSCFARERVGGVGAKLVWPNGMLQHGGVVLGMGFAAGHAYDRYFADEPGYADGILASRECGALTAACLLLRRDDFWRVGGFDERAFPVAFNDVDLSLKLREAGKVLVWTPQARLLHRESASRLSDREMPAKRARLDKELAELRRRWGHKLVADDCYNPNLNLDAYAFTGLALPPRDRAFRFSPVTF